MKSVSGGLVALFALGVATAGAADAQVLRVMSWNLESGGAETDALADAILAFDGVDLWGFSEVEADWQRDLQRAAGLGEGAFFDGVLGTTGGGDRLLIVYDTKRFDLVRSMELDHINIGGRVRAPLAAHLRDRESGKEFLFVVNHLYRGSASGRHDQAVLLNDWAESQTLPVVAVGDYNFDYEVDESSRDAGFDLLIEDDVFRWVRPPVLVRTQCSVDRRNPSRCVYDSVLDFVFVANQAKDWPATSEIVVRTGDFPHDDRTPDHRPVLAEFDLSAVVDPVPTDPPMTLEQILDRLEELEAELRALRAALAAHIGGN